MPRLGLATIDISTLGGSGGAVTGIDDFVFESFSAGQMHPILTTSRTNLITYSEDISNAAWSKSLVTEASSIASPVSSNSFLIEETSYSSSVPGLQLAAGISVSAGTYTGSFYVKKNNLRYLGIVLGTSAQRIRTNFDFDTETFKTAIFTGSTTGSVSFEKDGDFYRISVKATFPSTVAAVFSLHPLATDTYPFFAFQDSDNRSFHVSGFQLEQDNFVSNYIPTVGSTVTVSTTLNDTSNVWDFDGTDIMIAEDPEDEGFWEESYPDGATLPELVLNGDYEDISQNFVENSTFETEFTVSQWNAFSSVTTLERSTEQAFEGSHSLKVAGADTRGVQASATQFGDDYEVGDVVEIIAYVYPTISPNNAIKTGVNASDRGITSNFTGLTLNQWNEVKYQVTITTAANNYISFLNSGTGEFYLDNVSARIVDPNDRWTLGAGWSIEDGKAVSAGDSTHSSCTQTLSLPTGQYEVSLNATVTSGSFSIQAQGSGTDTGAVINSSGAHTEIFTTTANRSTFSIRSNDGDGVGSIDNVTVREYAIQPLDI